MAVSLADLRTGGFKPMTEVVKICADPDVAEEMARLTEEFNEADAQLQAARDRAEQAKASKKLAESGVNPELVARREKLRADLEAAHELFLEAVGELKLQAIPAGEWALWRDEHPPRKDNLADQEHGLGFADSTALLGDLDKWAVSWNGEPFAPGDWDMFARVLSGDLLECVQVVVKLQELRLNPAPKLPSGLSETSSSGDS